MRFISASPSAPQGAGGRRFLIALQRYQLCIDNPNGVDDVLQCVDPAIITPAGLFKKFATRLSNAVGIFVPLWTVAINWTRNAVRSSSLADPGNYDANAGMQPNFA